MGVIGNNNEFDKIKIEELTRCSIYTLFRKADSRERWLTVILDASNMTPILPTFRVMGREKGSEELYINDQDNTQCYK